MAPDYRDRMMQRFNGREVGIWGFRAEGVAALDLVQQFGPAGVTIVDDKGLDPSWSSLDGREDVKIRGPFDGTDAAEHLRGCDVVLKSAGVSPYGALAQDLVAGGVELLGGMQLFFELVDPARVIAVTGTKGKSTTATAIHRILEAAGVRAALIGNVGTPVLTDLEARLADDAMCVVEVSSYQASEINRSPALGCLTSLYSDHLDWHRSLERYVADKTNLFAHPSPTIELHMGPDAINHPAARALPVTRVAYGTAGRCRLDDTSLVFDGHEVTRADRLQFVGEHNLINLCGAISVAASVADNGAAFRLAAGRALETMHPLRDRLEVVGTVAGVDYTIDVLATIPEATIAALSAHPNRQLALIAGGHDRGQDYAKLAAHIVASPNIRAVIGTPDTGGRLVAGVRAEAARSGRTAPLAAVEADDLVGAVELASAEVEPGGVVLLSPAAASFNRFTHYGKLSERYREIVDGLANGARR